jgi:hypothetical protein
MEDSLLMYVSKQFEVQIADKKRLAQNVAQEKPKLTSEWEPQ